MAGTIVEGRNVADNVTLTPDFCIIGSGAGGGVCALKLTEAGFDVLVLEEGPNIPKEKRTSARAGAKDAQRARGRNVQATLPGRRDASDEKRRREDFAGTLSRRWHCCELVRLFAAAPRNA
jgi:choline dehydrogenase-like flavoprotein